MGQWLFGELIGFQLGKWWSLLKAMKDVLSEINKHTKLNFLTEYHRKYQQDSLKKETLSTNLKCKLSSYVSCPQGIKSVED